MTDDEFVRAFLQGWPSDVHFGHREHLRLAWLVIERHGPEMAVEIVRQIEDEGLEKEWPPLNEAVQEVG